MSVELYIACHDCRKALWAGCDGFSGRQFLSANEVEMEALGAFLYKHIGHRLGYEFDHDVEEYELRRADQPSPTQDDAQ